MSTTPTPVRVIVEILSSESDRNGNRYHFARFYNPSKGREPVAVVEVGGESNARSMAHSLAGNDYEGCLYFEITLPKRTWNHARSHSGMIAYEGDPELNGTLCAAFGVPATALDKGAKS